MSDSRDQSSDVSFWYPAGRTTQYPSLEQPLHTELLIIGAGITGLTAALHLRRAGKQVVVVEARAVGSGVSGGTTAHLTEAVDTRYHQLASDFGKDGAALVARSSRAAMDCIAQLAANIDCDHEVVPGYLYCEDHDDESELEKELVAAKQAGLSVERDTRAILPFSISGAIRFDRQAQFHAGKYLDGLAKRCVEAGVVLFERSQVAEVIDGEPCEAVLANGTRVRARDIFCATHSPLTMVEFQTKLAHYRSYAIAVPAPAIENGLFWDTLDPYHYLRLATHQGKRYLIVGGEDHKTGTESNTEPHFDALARYTRNRFGDGKPAFRWSAQVIEPVDGLPYVGAGLGKGHVYFATGFSGNGMTLGTMAGMLVSDLVLGRPNEWAELYSANRIKPLASAADFVKENVTFPTHLVGDRLSKPEAASFDEIAPGEGKTMKLDGERVAVYREPNGHLQACSAVCTHLGCLVKFNRAEKTWDCPCHGSRFSVTGDVLDGPASKNLARHHIDEDAEQVAAKAKAAGA